MTKPINHQAIKTSFIQDGRVFEITGADIDSEGNIIGYHAAKLSPDLLTVIFEIIVDIGWVLGQGFLLGMIMVIVICLLGVFTV